MIVGVGLIAIAMVGAGCDRSSKQPASLPIEQIPTALQKAFAKAKPEVKALADQVVAAVSAPNYSKAFSDLQTLVAQPGLNKEQQDVAGRAILTVNSQLQSASQSSSDPQATQAAETLKNYRINK